MMAMTAEIIRAPFHCLRAADTNVARQAAANKNVKTVGRLMPSSVRPGGRLAKTGQSAPFANPPRDTMTKYAASANGVLTAEALEEACSHVWRDSNSIVMLGSDILNSEPVTSDDPSALVALKQHIAAAGPGSYLEDVLPRLRFGPPTR